CVDPALASPYANKEVHRHKHHFPEDVEKEQVHRYEDADHAGLEREHCDQKLSKPSMNRIPGGNQSKRNQKCSQQDKPDTEPIDTYVIANAQVEGADPGRVGLKLKTTRRIEVYRQKQRYQEGRDGNNQGDPLPGRFALSRHKQQRYSRERQESDYDKQEIIHMLVLVHSVVY